MIISTNGQCFHNDWVYAPGLFFRLRSGVPIEVTSCTVNDCNPQQHCVYKVQQLQRIVPLQEMLEHEKNHSKYSSYSSIRQLTITSSTKNAVFSSVSSSATRSNITQSNFHHHPKDIHTSIEQHTIYSFNLKRAVQRNIQPTLSNYCFLTMVTY